MARNFWPYMHGVEMYDLARNLYQQFPKNCCLVIGGFDTSDYFSTGRNWYFFNDLLSEIGFKRSPINFVYTKG